MIAVGVGVTYESLSGDLSQVNFSSAQMGHMVMDRNVDIWQAMVINQFCRGVATWLLDAWRLQPDFPKRSFSVEWTAPRRPLINPRNDVPAMVEEMESGLTSRQRQQRQLGLDPDTIRRERVEDMKADQKAGLPPIQPKQSGQAAGVLPASEPATQPKGE
jgi:capsid protein